MTINAQLLAKHFPPYLDKLDLPDFQQESCKILLSSLPNSLRILNLFGQLQSNGNSLSEISHNYPSHLLMIGINDKIDQNERDHFLNHPKNKYVELSIDTGIPRLITNRLIKSQALYYIVAGGNPIPENFKEINLPEFTLINSMSLNLIFSLLKETQLQNVKHLNIFTPNNTPNEFYHILKKLPPHLLTLEFTTPIFNPQDADSIIKNLPLHLQSLLIKGPIGEEGKKKFIEYKKHMEEQTGLPFVLRINWEHY